MKDLGKKDCSPPGRGKIFIISAPSGAGKTTLCRAVRENFPDMQYSVSHTTRLPRLDETDGVDYFFIEDAAFRKKIEQGEWAEWARVHDHYYGTSQQFLEKCLSAGRDILLDLDVQGAIQMLEHYPDSITIFVMPPSMDALRRRLEKRGTDTPKEIEKRLANAQAEMDRKDLYRYVIVNDSLTAAVARLLSIVESCRKGTGNGQLP